ncbi:glutamine synthetase family protein [Paenibacillus apiarius]|uniref:glutamine synthetase family protein n=1 Tax=Paenibacillus apiarius TaxID=46240 RepID=UPI00197F90E9|nr:glutamine synthetase family protein [Paenibacillus apiarius]MBN3523842.1 glutamine synthetase [Paenibacillus apiarius]
MQRSVPPVSQAAAPDASPEKGPEEEAPPISTADGVIQELQRNAVEYLRLQFTDMFGAMKQLIVHRDEAKAALEGKVLFDGSSVKGYGGVDQSDLALHPDPTSFHVETWHVKATRIASVYCDVRTADGDRAPGCTRSMLREVISEAKQMGYSYHIGVEGEFFLYPLDEQGVPIPETHDQGGYFDPFPLDRGEEAKLELLQEMRKQGFRLEASHHEVAPGQHEINFRFGEALSIADRWQTFKQLTKQVAMRNGLHATFMPKPMSGHNGNALHCNQSLQQKGRGNAFHDPEGRTELSDTALHFVAGLLNHAKGMAAISNPVVNSYKRLVPGHEAPTHIAWSGSNRSALIRIPAARGAGTRVEYRPPDPTANPYLLFAIMLKSGLEGIRNREAPPEEATGNLHALAEQACSPWDAYPRDLYEALQHMERDTLVRDVMGEEAIREYVSEKYREYGSYAAEVHDWEMTAYFRSF